MEHAPVTAADQGWRPYTGEGAHTDHVHISLSWAGARKQTSWWTKADQPASWPKAEKGSSGVDVRTLQYLLNAAGQSVDADGQFGAIAATPSTRSRAS